MKEKLKKIGWFRKTVKVIKNVLSNIYRCIRRCIVIAYLKKRRPVSNERIKVGFIAQSAGVWDKMEPVYSALKRNEHFYTYLFVVPEDNFKTYEIKPDYEENFFCTHYPESIKVLDNNGNCMDPKEYQVDYLFYQRPYDYRLPKMLRSSRMVQYTKCCYIPYGFVASDTFDGNNLKNEFFDNQYIMFMDSEYMKKKFIRRYPIASYIGAKQVEYLGYPALEKYIQWGKLENSEGYITWSPRWSFDSKNGESSFLKYKDQFLEYTKKNKGKYIFRPHPLMPVELVDKGILTEEQWKEYIYKLENNGVVYDVVSPIDSILRKTEILITDFSTIIGNFVMMGRPVIYCDTGVKLNPPYQEMRKCIYTVYDWENVEKICSRLQVGIDSTQSIRRSYVDQEEDSILGASERIVDRLIADAIIAK